MINPNNEESEEENNIDDINYALIPLFNRLLVAGSKEVGDKVAPDKPDGTFSGEKLQEIVGGYFEFIFVSTQVSNKNGVKEFINTILIVNEDGLSLKLPINIIASNFSGKMIVGNAIVVSAFQLS
jgi:hypothetical protein